MSRVIFDIETIGTDFDSLDEPSKEYLLKFAKTEEEAEEVKQGLAFYPMTGEVITIGMLNPDTSRGVVYYRGNEDKKLSQPLAGNKEIEKLSDVCDVEEDVRYIEVGDEKELLEKFWQDIKIYNQFITFNGRTFDCPFLILRSVILRVKASRDLMPYRYDDRIHLDLLDQLTFQGATRRFSLDFYCKSFGIKSPKEDGITGLDVPKLYQNGKCLEIAKYCCGDLKATKELWQRWDTFGKNYNSF